LRADGRFVYFNGNLSAPSALAVTPAVSFANVNEPTGVHLALTGRAGEARVSWASANTMRTGAVPMVRWGLNASAALARAPATTATYTAADVCPTAVGVPDPYAGTPDGISVAAGKGYLSPGELHSALLTALPAAPAVIFYSVGSDASGWSEVFRFTAPPRLGAPVRVAAVADVGQAELDGSNIVHGNRASAPFATRSYFSMTASLNTTAALAREVASGSASLVLHNGDISYAMGYAALWDVYFERMQAAAAGAPLMTAVGNHEHNWPANPHSGGRFNATNLDSGGECGVAYAARLPMPPPAHASADVAWYSFDFGAFHFTTISTEHAFAPGSPQYAFVAADLAAAAAARDAAVLDADGAGGASAPRWIVFNGHRPFYIDSPYNSGPSGDGPVAAELDAVFGPLWRAHGVDLTLTGHHHSYQRSQALSYGMAQTACADGAEAGTRHVVIGFGGAGLTASGGPQAVLFDVVNTARHGYARIAANATALTLTAVASDNGAILDTFTLTKPPGPRTCFPTEPSYDDIQFTNPALEDTTLILACIVSCIVACGYGARAVMQAQEERAWRQHARAATARLLQQCGADGDDEDAAAERAAAATNAAAKAAVAPASPPPPPAHEHADVSDSYA
jgi:hypothetical protein